MDDRCRETCIVMPTGNRVVFVVGEESSVSENGAISLNVWVTEVDVAAHDRGSSVSAPGADTCDPVEGQVVRPQPCGQEVLRHRGRRSPESRRRARGAAPRQDGGCDKDD